MKPGSIPVFRLICGIFLTTVLLSAGLAAEAAVPLVDIPQLLEQPRMTVAEQKRLEKLLADEQRLVEEGAKFFGTTPERLLALDSRSQICRQAQYMAFTEIRRTRRRADQISYARDRLSQGEWCEKTVSEATGGMTVGQVLPFKGVFSLYYVLKKDMEARMAGLQER